MNGLKSIIPDAKKREQHILTKMLYGVDIQPRNCVLACLRLSFDDKLPINIACANSLKFDFWGKKFHICTSNPPYQSASGNKGAGNILWDKFVIKANELIEDDGYICLVHPSLWRKPNHKMKDVILANDMLYLEIHDHKDGQKIFGANTRYDWYVSKKSSLHHGKTTVVGQDGKKIVVNLNDLPFIPNSDFEFVKSLIAKDGEEKVEIINDRTAYGADKKWMAKEKDEKHPYPCVYMVKMNNESILKWSSRNDNGHFGVSKIVYGSGEGCMGNFYPDVNGEYGMTQWASGIVDNPKKFNEIISALQTDKFKKLCAVISMSKVEINTSVLRFFRKDFWREFI
jgi:hypothetical protein